ncbi:MAG: hypothetical protein DMD60_02160 [Gemmatimonadetes bacterium]|nr:MAG: hypothetical protein DMD60_02160 [Gemmatimonadota bacterium]
MTRGFDAPRQLVFDAHTKPDLIKRWLLGPPGWFVDTEGFDEAWYPGEALNTLVLVEKGGRTTLTQTVRYESREARDAVLKSGMESGVAASYQRLADLLASKPS